MSTTITGLPPMTDPVASDDVLALDDVSANRTRKVTVPQILASMGIASYDSGSLPSGVTNMQIFVTDAVKVGEGSGSGTGVLCLYDGTNWIAADTGSAFTT